MGIVYIVTNNDYNRVKIGFTGRKEKDMLRRYKTVLGNDLELITFLASDARSLEKRFICAFKHRHINHELYKKEFINEYIEFFSRYTRGARKRLRF